MAHVITAEKDGETFWGNIQKVSQKTGFHPNTISGWIKDKKHKVLKNDWLITVNIEKL